MSDSWRFVEGQKRHTQDGCQLALLMKKARPHQSLRAIDVGCGDGIIASELFRLKRATQIKCIDINPDAIEAARSNLQTWIRSEQADVELRSAQSFFGRKTEWDRYERFVINPPFFTQGSGRQNKTELDQMARHEGSLKLLVWARGARRLLRTGGELYCVFPTERLAELLRELSRHLVEPKELWWLVDDKRRRRFFLRAVRGAKPGLRVHFDFHLKAAGERQDT